MIEIKTLIDCLIKMNKGKVTTSIFILSAGAASVRMRIMQGSGLKTKHIIVKHSTHQDKNFAEIRL